MSFLYTIKTRGVKNFFAIFYLVTIIFLVQPQTVDASGIVWDPGNYVPNYTSSFLEGGMIAKEYGLDAAAWFAANLVIKKMAAQTVNWINSGFKGNPAYVTDPNQFFLDIGDDAVSNFISRNPALNNLCSPFKAEVRLALVKNYLSDEGGNYSCTLSKIKDNYDQFMGDFTQGGWDGWFEITQNDQNNPQGAYLNARDQMYIQIGNQQNKYQKQIDLGNGFLSYEKCNDRSLVTEKMLSDAEPIDDGSPLAGYKVGDCMNNDYITVTPGSVIEKQLNEVLSSGQKRLEASDEIDEILSALMKQLVSQVMGKAEGLLGASKKSTTGGLSYTDQLNSEPEQGPSNKGGYVDCTTGPSTTDADGNVIPGEYSCTTRPPEIPTPEDPTTDQQVYCTTDSSGVMTCSTTPPNTGGGGGGQCIPPSDPEKHGDHTAEVATAKQQLVDQGMIFDPNASNFECNRYEVVKLAVQLIGGDAMLLSKSGGTSCQGYSTDTITFPDGYTYDVLNGSAPDGAGPMWSSSTCLSSSGGTTGTGGGTAPASLLGDMTTERNNYPSSFSSLCTNPSGLEPTSCPLGYILNTVAWNNRASGWGLSQKTSGHRCPSPAGEIACDILGYQPNNSIYDVFIDSENSATPTWGSGGSAPRPWVAPVQP